jgi:uncharacterized OB-fold protein
MTRISSREKDFASISNPNPQNGKFRYEKLKQQDLLKQKQQNGGLSFPYMSTMYHCGEGQKVREVSNGEVWEESLF